MKPGKVYLMGAGPGDPGLITRKAIECLAQADVVVYDRLIDDSLLTLARPGAEMIYVGKASSDHTLPQDQINRLLVEKAKEGKVVVRTKGGDPFVFGRGGEEAQELVANGIPFEVVPGITSAIAVPAYAGIPVTQRGVASSFAVITGHEDPGKTESSIDWANISTGVDTLVFLMGLQNLEDIVTNLVKHGRPAETPAAVIKDGTRPTQVVVTGTLKDLAARVRECNITSPAIIVVGEVVRLRETLGWFDTRPLFGKRVLVTRARSQASALTALLAERGAIPVELPAIDIQPITDNKQMREAIARIHDYDWVAFTSANAATAFFDALHYVKLDARALGGVKVASIGAATSHALQDKGILPDFQPEAFTGADLGKGLGKLDVKGKRFLLPRADIADADVVKAIEDAGGIVDDIAIYRTVPATESVARVRQTLNDGGIDVVTFASSSTVTNLVQALDGDVTGLRNVMIAAIGPKTAETAANAGLKVDIVAREQTIPGLVGEIEDYFGRAEEKCRTSPG